ncbi:hypothetical protein [Marinitenerispora sediminis]|uniref:Uncharacterized protein n=1 Tax=Marinitenerispora sediminis TaxID=1931232 RepID=A0A368T4I2_9ACTN|nr:hypothetical protein [Marinitenerispora sediminis]RCV57598.1 hypothetical protein DEF28_01395 [Marinitenerispora sediminis]RCV58313.1 hypothetical protein DEF24_13940 [Marinitenerispora sediminis]RCV59655.1 hypothetical protein DEF23_06665 [Marinitenerispora sediminis]
MTDRTRNGAPSGPARRGRRTAGGLAATVTAAVAVAALLAADAGPPAGTRCDRIDPPPTADADGGFTAVAAGGPRHVWAFGTFYPAGTDPYGGDANPVPRGLRWDGQTWHELDLPASWPDATLAAAASGPDDLWVVGEEAADVERAEWFVADPAEYTAMHHDGSRWRRYVLTDLLDPALHSGEGAEPRIVTDLEVIAPDDVWLVAEVGTQVWSRGPGATRHVLHFDGAGWSRAALPPTGYELAALGPDNVIAVGTDGRQLTAERWDGAVWRPMPVPEQPLPTGTGGRDRYEFTGVHAEAPDDVWAVGRLVNSDGLSSVRGAVLAHWDGTAWQVALDDPDRSYLSVTGDGAGGLWITRGAGGILPEPPAIDGDLLHRGPGGAMTPYDVDAAAPPDRVYHDAAPNPLERTSVVRVPGTTDLVVAGTLTETSDGDPVTQHGAVRLCTW